MKCPFCSSEELKVIDSRDAMEGKATRRRRECLACQRRFTTFETLELAIQVQKKDGRYEDFQQQKLTQGLEAACSHTKISREQVIILAAKITDEIMQKQVHEVTTKEIGEMVMKQLRDMDSISYIRFACVYRRFKEIDELLEAIESVCSNRTKPIFEEVTHGAEKK